MIFSLHLKNFRRYVDQKLSFKEGVNFIDGENNAGKSTLFYAIEYALFGKVAGYQTLAALMHPKSKQMGVEIVFEGKGGARYRLQRMHEIPGKSRTKVVGYFTLKALETDEGELTGNETYLASSEFQDREEHLAARIFEITGLSRKLFDTAVHLRQGQITQILAGEKSLDHVLGVTASVMAGEEMRAMALEFEKEAKNLPSVIEAVERLETTQREQEERLVADQKELSEAREQFANFDEVLSLCERARVAHDAVRALVTQERACFDEVNARATGEETERQVQEIGSELGEKTLAQVSKEASFFENQKTAFKSALAEVGEQKNVQQRSLGDLLGRIERREKQLASESAECESCGQMLDKKAAASELGVWKSEAEALDEGLKTCERSLENTRGELSALEEEERIFERYQAAQVSAKESAKAQKEAADSWEGSRETLRAAFEENEWASHESLSLDFDADSLGKKGDPAAGEKLETALAGYRERTLELRVRTETQKSAKAERIESLGEALAQEKQRALSLAKDLASAKAERLALGKKEEAAKKLRKLAAAFKELQVQVRERACEQLAKDTLKVHDILAAPAKEYKSLSVDQAKYTVMVTPKDIGKKVPAHASQGGGHRLLLGLAFKLAIAKLVGPCPFVLLDEPTYGLDETRRTQLFERINTLGESTQMLLITHQAATVPGHHVAIEKAGKESRSVMP